MKIVQLNKEDLAYIDEAYLYAMKGKPMSLLEGRKCSKWVARLVESEYNFVKLQGTAIATLADRLDQDPDSLALKIDSSGFKAARDYIVNNYPLLGVNKFDVEREDEAVEMLVSIFAEHLNE